MLNNFSHGCFNYKCPPLCPTSTSIAALHGNHDSANFPTDFLCSCDYVADMLSGLDLSKSSGPDDITPRMLKSTAYSITPSLTQIYTFSLTSGIFPTDWKLARVVPVPKADNLRASVTGYCPISILPVVSKILESHVKEIILNSISGTNSISKHQWGFMHHRSSTSALISVVQDWLTALEDGNEICVIFFDVQKAFDSVPHAPLLQKLADIGINPYLLRWIQS